MNASIVPTTEAHLLDLYEVINAVARERRFLAFTQLPSLEQSLAFYRSILKAEFPYFNALIDRKVVGWCDVSPAVGQSRSHIGVLGMGLLPEVRHRGLGNQLLQAAIEKSWKSGLTRIELTVRDDNRNAKALYEKFGFQVEGVFRRGSVIGTECHDVFAMALLR